MDDLIAFLRARIDEDEQAAREAGSRTAQWATADRPDRAWGADTRPAQIIAAGKPIIEFNDEYGAALAADHVALHDPARVLAEVDAKRRIIAGYERFAAERRRMMGGWDPGDVSPILTALALPYADHPDYREEWRL